MYILTHNLWCVCERSEVSVAAVVCQKLFIDFFSVLRLCFSFIFCFIIYAIPFFQYFFYFLLSYVLTHTLWFFWPRSRKLWCVDTFDDEFYFVYEIFKACWHWNLANFINYCLIFYVNCQQSQIIILIQFRNFIPNCFELTHL